MIRPRPLCRSCASWGQMPVKVRLRGLSANSEPGGLVLTQAIGHGLNDLHRNLLPVANCVTELLMAQNHQCAGRGGRDSGRRGPTVEHADLAEEIARP